MAIRQNGISEFTRAGSVMTWTYGGDVAPTTFDMASNPQWAEFSDFSRDVYANGIKQKIGDAAAIKDATVAEKAAEQARVAAQLTAQIWIGERMSMLSEALQRMFGKTAAEVAAVLKDLTKEERAKLEKDEAVVKTIAKIQTERAKKAGIDASDVMAKFK